MRSKVSNQHETSDKLSEIRTAAFDVKSLTKLAMSLSDENRQHETELRRDLGSLTARIVQDRFELGRVLSGYRELYKTEGKWTIFCAAIGTNVRTAHRIISGFDAASGVDPDVRQLAMSRGIDLTATKHRPLLKELISRTPQGLTLADSEVDGLLAQSISSLPERNTRPTQRKDSDRVDRVLQYAVKAFADGDAGIRKAELLVLYTKLNSYFGIGAMTVPFASSPILVGSRLEAD
jgi:hypothetical protein